VDLRELLVGSLLYVVFPAWVFAGFVDYLCHRASDIAHTSGEKESALHLAQWAQIAAAIAIGLAFEINTLVLTLLAVLVVVHALTGAWDVSFTIRRRHISALEQHAHSYMETAPFIAFGIVVLLHWDVVRSVWRLGEPAGLTLVLRSDLPPGAALWIVGAGLAAGLAAILEELWRTTRAARGGTALASVPATRGTGDAT
jgi:hypothetical protein